MIRRIVLLYRIEIVKALRRRQSFVAPLLLLAVIALSPLVHPVVRDGIGDYDFIAYVTPLSLNFLGYIMLITFSATLVASETEHGAIRATLLRPVTRGEFLAAKMLLGYSYAALLTFIVGTASWTVAWLRGDLLGVHLGGELVFTGEQMVRSYAAGSLLSLLPQWAGVSLALFFSTVARGSGMAISLTLGTWILADLIKYPLGFAPVVYSTYLEAPWKVFAGRCDALDYGWLPMAWQCALCSLVTIVAASGLALLVFRRRNLGGC